MVLSGCCRFIVHRERDVVASMGYDMLPFTLFFSKKWGLDKGQLTMRVLYSFVVVVYMYDKGKVRCVPIGRGKELNQKRVHFVLQTRRERGRHKSLLGGKEEPHGDDLSKEAATMLHEREAQQVGSVITGGG
ncbi:hypothetical protein CDAR_109251 [Caerostris darwini]|uniref:Uncharacterized protein n=1 Tax=Caerostris darwini TaxID=1538125 RepID=A0AAV4TVD1_9ARAC|nr:hypothetical protein CDAR_109251 [Caerostris darwini]